MTAHFELQPTESELQKLAEQYWQEACNKERQLETEAFEAGAAIRNGDGIRGWLKRVVERSSASLWLAGKLCSTLSPRYRTELPRRRA